VRRRCRRLGRVKAVGVVRQAGGERASEWTDGWYMKGFATQVFINTGVTHLIETELA
jgi:hypothetical protein